MPLQETEGGVAKSRLRRSGSRKELVRSSEHMCLLDHTSQLWNAFLLINRPRFLLGAARDRSLRPSLEECDIRLARQARVVPGEKEKCCDKCNAKTDDDAVVLPDMAVGIVVR